LQQKTTERGGELTATQGYDNRRHHYRRRRRSKSLPLLPLLPHQPPKMSAFTSAKSTVTGPRQFVVAVICTSAPLNFAPPTSGSVRRRSTAAPVTALRTYAKSTRRRQSTNPVHRSRSLTTRLTRGDRRLVVPSPHLSDNDPMTDDNRQCRNIPTYCNVSTRVSDCST